MDALSWNLLAAAAGLGVVHTIAGPDHWLPFVALGRARGWRRGRTLGVTLLCGAGHVGASVVLGIAALALGWEGTRVAGLESARGDLAAWALVAFGTAYALWGIRRTLRRRAAIAPHDHDAGDRARILSRQTTFWSLFVIFVLGPCEPMIPLFVLPLARGDLALAGVTAAVFSAATLLAMAAAVLLALAGFERIRVPFLERWSHPLAGATVAACGAAILLFGL